MNHFKFSQGVYHLCIGAGARPSLAFLLGMRFFFTGSTGKQRIEGRLLQIKYS